MNKSTTLLRTALREIANAANCAADAIGDTNSVRTLVTGVPAILQDLHVRTLRATVDWSVQKGIEGVELDKKFTAASE